MLCVRAVRALRSCVRAFVLFGACSGLVLFGAGAVRAGGWVAGGRVGAHARAGWFYTERGARSPPLASARLRSLACRRARVGVLVSAVGAVSIPLGVSAVDAVSIPLGVSAVRCTKMLPLLGGSMGGVIAVC